MFMSVIQHKRFQWLTLNWIEILQKTLETILFISKFTKIKFIDVITDFFLFQMRHSHILCYWWIFFKYCEFFLQLIALKGIVIQYCRLIFSFNMAAENKGNPVKNKSWGFWKTKHWILWIWVRWWRMWPYLGRRLCNLALRQRKQWKCWHFVVSHKTQTVSVNVVDL